MEREIIGFLRESALNKLRLDESRRTPLDVFFDQLQGTLNRLEDIDKRYNSPGQQEILKDYVIDHLRFLHLNSDVIRKILETPQGETTGINLNDYLFESTGSREETESRLYEASSPIEMFAKEFDELYSRAKSVSSKLNDDEQSREFEGIVMSRLKYIDSALDKVIDILRSDSEADISRIIKSLRGKLRYAKAQSSIGKDLPPIDVSGDAPVVSSSSAEKLRLMGNVVNTLSSLPFVNANSPSGSPLVESEGNRIKASWRDTAISNDTSSIESAVNKAFGKLPGSPDLRISVEIGDKSWIHVTVIVR